MSGLPPIPQATYDAILPQQASQKELIENAHHQLRAIPQLLQQSLLPQQPLELQNALQTAANQHFQIRPMQSPDLQLLENRINDLSIQMQVFANMYNITAMQKENLQNSVEEKDKATKAHIQNLETALSNKDNEIATQASLIATQKKQLEMQTKVLAEVNAASQQVISQQNLMNQNLQAKIETYEKGLKSLEKLTQVPLAGLGGLLAGCTNPVFSYWRILDAEEKKIRMELLQISKENK